MDPVELGLARGKALEILKAHLDRERPVGEESLGAYMVEELLLTWLARLGHPMLRSQLNGSVMTYLKDGGLVVYKSCQPAGPKGPTLLAWRITHDGLQVLEGTKADAGVRVV
ncbi:MAG: hypothetical protein ABSD47_01170 [Candidatus Methylomirabilota bacterium]|jgi:hypothetical protein